MITRSRDWKAVEEKGRAFENGDFFGAPGIMENNWGQEEGGELGVPRKPECRRRFRRGTTFLFGGGIRER
jgi:hypothetical protein